MIRQLIGPYLDIVKYRSRTVMFLWGAFVGAMLAGSDVGTQPLFPTIAGPLAMYLVGLFAYVYNDVQDLEADKINASNRPLPSGRVSKDQAMKLAIATGASAFAISLFLNPWVVAAVSLGLALGLVYSTPPISLKNRYLLKWFVASLWAAVASLGGSLAVSGYVTGKTLYSALLFLAYGLAMSPMADIADIEGDRVAGKRTIATEMGPIFTVRMSTAIMIFNIVATALFCSSLGFNLACPILVGIFSLLATRTTWPLIKRFNDKSFQGNTIKKLALLSLAINASLIAGTL